MKSVNVKRDYRPSCEGRSSRRRRLRIESLERRRLLAADVRINEFLAANDTGLTDAAGRTTDWIELHNAGDEAADLQGWHLSDDVTDKSKWTFPVSAASVLAPGDYRVIFASGDGVADAGGALHTSFSLNASGDHLLLARPDQTVVSQFAGNGSEFPGQRADISYGIGSGGGPRYFTPPTPGAANGVGLLGFVADTTFSVDRGYYDGPVQVEINSATPGATLVYTTDGSTPTLSNGNQIFAGSTFAATTTVTVGTTTAVRAAAFKTDHLPTDVDTQTYLFLTDVIRQPTDPAGFPTTWGTAPAADYAMDQQIVDDTAYQTDLLAGLRDLPALSLNTDVNDLFGAGGIYSNPNNGNLEVPISAEYMLADGSSGFQIDAGLKVAGGASRNPNNSPKHSLSLRFRQEYGDSKLDYELFEGSPVEEFNSLQLRAMYNNSWIHWDNGQRGRGTLIRDQFIRDSLLAAGQDDAGQGSYAHLYLNGIYWGVYNLHERHDSSHYAEYNGGDSGDYDALNGGAVIDGTIDSFNALRSVVSAGDWTSIGAALDVDNFIDWSIAQAYGGNADLKVNGNWRASGGGIGGGLWRFYSWDSERVLEGVTAKPPETMTDATGMFNDLLTVPEFRVRFGDRLRLHFFDGGAFSPAAVATRWNARVDDLRLAIVAESARWGDYRRDVHPRGATPSLYTRDDHWLPEQTRLNESYFPARSEFVLDRYRQMGLFPEIDAPEFMVDRQRHGGGQVAAGSDLRLLGSTEAIYYTTDGSDPRAIGGAVSPTAITYLPTSSESDAVSSGARWKFDDRGVDLGDVWREPGYDDLSWSMGESELGYGDGDEATVVGFGGNSGARNITTYFRKQILMAEGGYDFAKVRIRRDDGVAVYWNGTEIGRDNLPDGPLSFETKAINAASDDGSDWLTFLVTADQLQIGNNVLAAEIHQVHGTSSDVSFDAEVVLVTQSQPAIALNDTIDLRARSRDSSGNWSAVRQALFLVPHEPATSANLRISEIHYDPADNADAEFIELKNISSGVAAVKVDLDGIVLTDGPSLPLEIAPGTSLGPGQYALLVKDVAAFTAAYPAVDPSVIIGQYDGKLSNGGERVRIIDAAGAEIVDVVYGDSDPWPRWAGGRGGSLVLRDADSSTTDRLAKHYAWAGSVLPGGTPGADSATPTGVVINEILSHTDAPQRDAIELWNSAVSAVDIGGWFLSDDRDIPLKFEIPPGTMLPPGGYVSFDENDFNSDLLSPTSFALDGSGGDSVWLFTADQGAVTSLVDEVSFEATFNGVSLGRMPEGGGRLVPLAHPSLGAVNGMFAVSDVIISEVHYHPSDPTAADLALAPTLRSSDLEFIELLNHSGEVKELADWRLRGESDFDFDFLAEHSIAPLGTMVLVGFDPDLASNDAREAAFRAHHQIAAAIPLIGPLSGSLANGEGLVRLLAVDMPPADNPALVPRVLVDEVLYDDLPSWPVNADGGGASLQRIAPSTLGNFSDSWIAGPPSPGNVPPTPQILNVSVNGGAATRSSVTSLSIEFDSAVDLRSDAFQLTNLSTGQLVSGTAVSTVLSEGRTVAQISFTSGASIVTGGGVAIDSTLSDGTYQLTIHAAAVTSAATGFPLEIDRVDSFYRRFGDQDGDGVVGLFDFAAFRSSYGVAEGDDRFASDLDSDRDGLITLFDFAAFRANYGA